MRKLHHGRRRVAVVLAAVGAIAGTVGMTVGSAAAADQAVPDKKMWFAKSEPGQTFSTGARAKYDAAQGVAFAKKAGPPVTLPKKKVGWLQIAGQVYSAQRTERAAALAVKTIGWTMVRCDAQGDPAKMESCGQSLLNQGVDVIMGPGIEPTFIKGTITRAKQKKVPIVITSGAVQKTPDIYNYHPNEPKGAKTLAEAAIKSLQALPGTKEVAVWTYPAGWAADRTKQFVDAVKKTTDIKIAFTSDIDGLNVVDGTRAGLETQLTQKPDLKGVWLSYDAAAFGAAQAVNSKFAGKSFPDRPCLWTQSYDQFNGAALRKGDICILVDAAYDNFNWIALDQIAEWFARGKAPSRKIDGGYGTSVSFEEPYIITKENQPKAGFWVQTPTSAPTFFSAKWKAEFKK